MGYNPPPPCISALLPGDFIQPHACTKPSLTLSIAGILATLRLGADPDQQGVLTRPLVSGAEVLVLQVHHHSLQHPLIGELIGQVASQGLGREGGKGGRRERRERREGGREGGEGGSEGGRGGRRGIMLLDLAVQDSTSILRKNTSISHDNSLSSC